MVGPIDVQNVILNATAQSQINSNALAQAAVGEAFKAVMSKKEEETKATSVEESSRTQHEGIDRDKERIRKKNQRRHIDLKA